MVQEENIGIFSRSKRQKWTTDEILDLMEERRLVKGNKLECKRVNKNIRKMCRQAKENYWNIRCDEIEELQEIRGLFNLHRKVKEVVGNCRKSKSTH